MKAVALLPLALVLCSAGCDLGEPGPASAHFRAAASCGNGIVDPGEACDLGSGNAVGAACTNRCERPVCGDGLVAPHEDCDDGNDLDGDGCSAQCSDEHQPIWSSDIELAGPEGEAVYDIAFDDTGIYAVGRVSTAWQTGVPFVVRMDRNGRVSWIDEPASLPSRAAAAHGVIVHEGDAIVVGALTDDAGDSSSWAWRYGPDGTLRWDGPLLDGDATATALLVDGSEVLVAGSVVSEIKEDAWFGWLSVEDGTLRAWHRLEAPQREHVAAAAMTPDKQVVLAGTKGNAAWLAAFALDGQMQWEQIVEGDIRAAAVALAASEDGVYAAGWIEDGLAGVDGFGYNLDAWVARYAFDGSQVWWRTSADPERLPDHAGDLALLPDGNVTVVGQTQTSPLLVPARWDRDAFLTTWSPDGELLWTRSHDGALHGRDGASAVAVTPSGTLLTAGHTTVLFEGSNAWVAEFAAQGTPPQPSTELTPAELTEATDVIAETRRSPAAPTPSRDDDPRRGSHRATLYLDFDGGLLRPGDRGPLGEVSCIDAPLTFPGYPGDEQSAAAVAQVVQDALQPYGVSVVWERPPPGHLPYTTIMVGGMPEQLGLPETTAGYACDVDCGDTSRREVAFAFLSESTQILGRNAVHEAAHTWGLDHIEDDGFIMYPFSQPGEPAWRTECAPISEKTNKAYCMAEHEAFCPPGQQNSHAELLALLGERGPDTQPPTAEILSPPEDVRLDPGQTLSVEVEVDDDFGDPGWKLVVAGLGWEQIAWEGETEFSLVLPIGRHVVELHALDHARNETVVRRTIVVGEPEPQTGSALGPSSGPTGPQDETGGCRVTVQRDRTGSAVLGLLWLLGWLRQRLRRVPA